MKKIANLLFTLFLLVAVNDVQSQDVNPHIQVTQGVAMSGVAMTAWQSSIYFMHESDYHKRSRFIAGFASYHLIDLFINKHQDPSLGRSLIALAATTVVNSAVGYGVNGWDMERNYASLSGVFSGFVVSYTLRF